MSTFYYLAVSVSDSRRTAGNIQAETEQAAREELHGMGLSVLGIGTEPFVDQAAQASEADGAAARQVFCFEARDKQGKDIDGTIEASDLLGAYERLLDEFQFTVKTLYPDGASDAEIAHARAHSLAEIQAQRAQRDAVDTATKRNTLTGSISDLMRRAEKKLSGEKDETQKEIRHEQLVTSVAQESTEIQAAERQQLEDLAGEKPVVVREPLSLDDPTLSAAPQVPVDAVVPQPVPVAPVAAPVAPTPRPTPTVDVAHTPYALINQLILPDTMSRADAARELGDMCMSYIRTHILSHVHTGPTMWRDAARFVYEAVLVLLGALAAIYFSFFFISHIALSYSWGALSLLAESVVGRSTAVPFFAFAFLLLFAVLYSYQFYVLQALLRTSVLLGISALFLVVAGVNVLY